MFLGARKYSKHWQYIANMAKLEMFDLRDIAGLVQDHHKKQIS